MNRKDAVMLVAYAKELWPNYRMPDSDETLAVRVEAWMDVLGDLDPDDIRHSLIILSAREFVPPPGEVRQVVLELTGQVPELPRWDVYFHWIREKVRMCSLYKLDDKPDFVCPWPALAGVVTLRDMVDWADQGITAHDFEMVVQAHIRRRFEPAVQHAIRTGGPLPPALEHRRTERLIEGLGDGPQKALKRSYGFIGLGEPDGRS